ncbi:MAG: SpoVA/SpoVAEb family sporulation membrane protein [Bacilli bacterium]|nr:SpoVA/SpoVAEb family sporulation membrane protein [Bacilli bacterium]
MNKNKYLKIVKDLTPKEKKLENSALAFLMGGVLGFIAEGIKLLLVYNLHLTVKDATTWVLIIYILMASIFTALSFFDKLVMKYKCGLIVPITGFAHSITSSALDYKTDGLITGVGASFFKLAGCILLYGIVSAFFFAIIKVIIYV